MTVSVQKERKTHQRLKYECFLLAKTNSVQKADRSNKETVENVCEVVHVYAFLCLLTVRTQVCWKY